MISSVVGEIGDRLKSRKPESEELPADMSATSLVGGGMIAGDALAAVGKGVFGLLKTMWGG